MSRLAPIKAKKLVKILNKLDFVCLRQKGSHAFFEHPDGRTTLIPIHQGEEISRELLHKIITQDLNMAIDEFDKLR